MYRVYFCKKGRMDKRDVVNVPWHDLTHNTPILVSFVVIFYMPDKRVIPILWPLLLQIKSCHKGQMDTAC